MFVISQVCIRATTGLSPGIVFEWHIPNAELHLLGIQIFTNICVLFCNNFVYILCFLCLYWCRLSLFLYSDSIGEGVRFMTVDCHDVRLILFTGPMYAQIVFKARQTKPVRARSNGIAVSTARFVTRQTQFTNVWQRKLPLSVTWKWTNRNIWWPKFFVILLLTITVDDTDDWWSTTHSRFSDRFLFS